MMYRRNNQLAGSVFAASPAYLRKSSRGQKFVFESIRRITSTAARGLSLATHSKMPSRSRSASGRIKTFIEPKRLRRASNSFERQELRILVRAPPAHLRKLLIRQLERAFVLLFDEQEHVSCLALTLRRPTPDPLKNSVYLFDHISL